MLEGSVRKAGSKVRITGQLIDTATGAHLWADRFDGALDDIFGLQDTIVDQAIIINPNLSEARRIRGWISIFLGRHEVAAQQFQHAMRLNPLDPEIRKTETGLAMANFLLRRFEIALSWATKSMARQKNYAVPVRFAAASYVMLGRIADAKALLAQSNASGNPLTISRFKKRTPLKRQEDVDLLTEAYRLAGMPE